MSDLFRNEAIEAYRPKLNGAILLRRTWLTSMLVVFFCGCLLLFLLFFFLVGFARKETLSGVVLPDLGLLQVSAAQAGTINQLRVREGALVRRGDLLLTINSDLTAQQGDSAAHVDPALNEQMHSLRQQHKQISDQEQIKRPRIERELANMNADLQRQRVEQNSAESDVRGQIEIRAAIDGRISALAIDRGQLVSAGQPLLRIVPEGAVLEVVLYAPTRSMGFLHADMPVKIRYDAFPYQKYGQYPGTIREISSSPVLGSEAAQWITNGAQNEPVYRVRVTVPPTSLNIAGRATALQTGMRLQASVALEYRKLYQWAFEPLASLRGSVQ